MTVNQLARHFKVRPAVIYDVIYTLETRDGIKFNKIGRFYTLKDEEIEIITQELKKRGYSEN